MTNHVAISLAYQSETSKHRDLIVEYCTGYGIDIGFGGDPITPNAIRVDLPEPYAVTGFETVQLGGDCRDLRWFRNNVLDYVYSSHVLEDFDIQETEEVLKEWVRVLRPGGRLILLLPDQQLYRQYCQRSGQPYNTHHSIDTFSSQYVKDVAARLGNLDVLQEIPRLGEYSFLLVFEKNLFRELAFDELTDLRSKLHKALADRDHIKVAYNGSLQRLKSLEQSRIVKLALALYRLKRRIFAFVNPERK